MRIEVHTHYLPEPFRRRLREWDMSVRIEDRDGMPFVVHTTGSFPLFPGFRDPEARVEWMDENDIDYMLLSPSTPNPNEGPFSVEQSTELIQSINDGYADIQEEYPDRFGGLGPLPLRDPEAAVEELDRIVEMGLKGVMLPTTVRDRKLSDPELTPVFDKLEETGLPVFVHPGRNQLSQQLDDDEWIFTPMTVFPTETTHQIARLIFDGFFDRHDDLDLVLSHMGGALTHLVGRLERGYDQFRSDDESTPERPISEYVEEFYYDTISFHPPAMQAAIDTVGSDRLLFGTDYPFGMENIEGTLDSIDALDLSADEQEAIMGGTAAELFDI
ncbi:amidohydrolase family protein [Halomicroarcula sp. GCM10025324]|uniref:amidohydrolase family protein n=1 Tax=Haloarcula TaxID=2237 RepID=UPI0023E8C022|nr:amidohydrolase family protein [Halomicroarcula sp. ZS-22-S1]